MRPLTPSLPPAQVSINGKKVDLSYSFLDSRGVSQCVDSSPCDRRPCQHGGKCLLTGEYEFQCLCRDGYKGEAARRGGGRAGSEPPRGLASLGRIREASSSFLPRPCARTWALSAPMCLPAPALS